MWSLDSSLYPPSCWKIATRANKIPVSIATDIIVGLERRDYYSRLVSHPDHTDVKFLILRSIERLWILRLAQVRPEEQYRVVEPHSLFQDRWQGDKQLIALSVY